MRATALDCVWVLLSSCLVFFMHAGFALVESGLCRRKNTASILLKNLGVVALGSIVFFLVGFGVMFGEGNAWIGLSHFAPQAGQRVPALPAGMPLFVFLFFQLVFAATAATIVSGAVAERARFGTFFVFTALACGLIYPLVGHWVWGGGWLATRGFHDFAGSTVVHAAGGAMALAGAWTMGPRLGKYAADGSARLLPAHNLPLAALGVLILWLGWFGFNGGSTLNAEAAKVASVILSTNLAGAAGFLVALVHIKWRAGTYDLSMALNGALAGLVTITAGADVIHPNEALLVGALGALAVVEGVLLLDRLRIDDPVGAIPVHLGCGVLGTLLVGVFSSDPAQPGLLHGGSMHLLGIQAAGGLVSAAFAFCSGGSLWLALKHLAPGGIRVDPQEEIEGLDLSECGVHAYGEELAFAAQPAESPASEPPLWNAARAQNPRSSAS